MITEETKTHRRCRQTQCGYFVSEENPCRECDDCGAAPFEINKSCKKCDDCENVPGELRWGDGSEQKEQVLNAIKAACDQKIKELKTQRIKTVKEEKPMEVEMCCR